MELPDSARLLPVLAALATACASAPPPLPPPRWVPPPQWSRCSDAAPCENVKQWMQIEKEAELARLACEPVPVKGSEAACARASSGYSAVHREQLDAFSGLCAGSVGSSYWAVAPVLGTPENDRFATCGGKGGTATFTCRVLEWTWTTPTRAGAFVVFLVQPEGQAPGVWALNACSYCVTPGDCRELPLRR